MVEKALSLVQMAGGTGQLDEAGTMGTPMPTRRLGSAGQGEGNEANWAMEKE